ncbi:MAG: SPOR domain-containing protein [Lewinellaceae bacterium]|nr:SPOR domain-containing protein [Lewinellaceae bacterium]
MMVESDDANNVNALFKLMVGPYPNSDAAEKARKTAVANGYRKSFVVALTGQ